MKVALEGLGCPFGSVFVDGAAVPGDGGGCVVVWRVVEVYCNAAGCSHAVQDDSLGVVVVFAEFVDDSGSEVWR